MDVCVLCEFFFKIEDDHQWIAKRVYFDISHIWGNVIDSDHFICPSHFIWQLKRNNLIVFIALLVIICRVLSVYYRLYTIRIECDVIDWAACRMYMWDDKNGETVVWIYKKKLNFTFRCRCRLLDKQTYRCGTMNKNVLFILDSERLERSIMIITIMN